MEWRETQRLHQRDVLSRPALSDHLDRRPFWSEDEAHRWRDDGRSRAPLLNNDVWLRRRGRWTNIAHFLAHLHVRGVCAVHRRHRHYVFPAWAAEERRLKNTRRKVRDSIMRCKVKHVGSSPSSSSSRLRFFSYTRNEIYKYSGRKGVYLIYFYLQSAVHLEKIAAR